VETQKPSAPPEKLWTTFYSALLGDISSLYPSISQEHEMFLIQKFERIFGEELYLKIFPEWGKILERALATGSAEMLDSEGENYGDYLLHNGTPRILNELWELVVAPNIGQTKVHCRFDHRDLPAARALEISMAVNVLRQFFLAFAKVTDVEPSASVDDEITSFSQRISNPAELTASRREFEMIRSVIRIIVQEDPYDVTDEAELVAPLAQWENDPFGRHGPGAVAGGEQGKRKWDFGSVKGLNPEMYEYFPADFLQALSASGDPLLARLQRIVSDPMERISSLAVVPKDFRGHRLICIEPKELQFAQQGLMKVLYKHIMSHYLTRRSIDFVDQGKSQKMSRSLRFATIDLKDASDSVSMRLGRMIFPRRFWKLMTRYRSSHVALPDGNLVESHILATMGSALCFPLETLVFYAIALSAMLIRRSCFPPVLLDVDFVRNMHGLRLRVFGDDIIVPCDDANCVISLLERCGFKVNAGKTCIEGLAREACGSWYYAQDDVRIVRFKSSELTSTAVWISLSEQAIALAKAGFTRASRSICEALHCKHPIPWGFNGFPYRRDTVMSRSDHRLESNALRNARGRKSPFYRWNNDLQRLEFRTPVREKFLTCEQYPHSTDGLYAYWTTQATHLWSLEDTGLPVKWEWVGITPTSMLE